MSGLTIYFDGFSQPSRAVLLLLHATDTPFEQTLIQIIKGETKTSKEFAKVNPNQQLPAIDDNGFCLSESAAILKYLCLKYKLPDHWYPSELTLQTRVDEYLSWHSSNLRKGAAGTFYHKLLFRQLTGQDPDPKKIEECTGTLERSKRLLEEYFLKEGKFIGGAEEISIADLQALCEFTQFLMVSNDPLEGRPRLAKWMEDCKSALQPHFDEVHKSVYKFREKGGKFDA